MPSSADISAVSIFLSLKTLYDFKPQLRKNESYCKCCGYNISKVLIKIKNWSFCERKNKRTIEVIECYVILDFDFCLRFGCERPSTRIWRLRTANSKTSCPSSATTSATATTKEIKSWWSRNYNLDSNHPVWQVSSHWWKLQNTVSLMNLLISESVLKKFFLSKLWNWKQHFGFREWIPERLDWRQSSWHSCPERFIQLWNSWWPG